MADTILVESRTGKDREQLTLAALHDPHEIASAAPPAIDVAAATHFLVAIRDPATQPPPINRMAVPYHRDGYGYNSQSPCTNMCMHWPPIG